MNRAELQTWIESPRGQRFLGIERTQVAAVLPDLSGRRIVQIGQWGLGDDLIRGHALLVGAVVGQFAGFEAGIVGQMDALPVMSDCADAVFIPHAHEFSQHPHQLLREADRILSHRGQIVMLGFNPWVLWSVRHTLGWPYSGFPTSGKFYSPGRICDWLKLLNFEVEEVKRYGRAYAAAEARWSPAVAKHLCRLTGPLSDGWLIRARKRVYPLTPMRDRWRANEPAVNIGAVEYFRK